jgi:hypothetical protein
LLESALAHDLKSVGMGAGDYWYLLGVAQRAGGDAAALRGDREAALALLPALLRTSYYSFLYGTPLPPALLRQDPVWDRLRSDPRFQSLASQAPAERPR